MRILGRLMLGAALGAFALRANAAIFSVPTNLNADGSTSATTVNPPGWWELDGAGTGFAGGEGVHQIRLFVEVTGLRVLFAADARFGSKVAAPRRWEWLLFIG